MLTGIQIDLIEAIKNKQPATSLYLADCLMCSKRSIINYVKEINEEYPSLIRSSKKGYYLDSQLFDTIAEEYHFTSQYSTDYRIKEIIKALFLSNNDAISINKLSAALYVSDSTLRADIYDLKKRTDSTLNITINKADVKIRGTEVNLRSFYFSCISRLQKLYFYNEDSFSDFFPQTPILEITKEIENAIADNRISINEFMFPSLLLQILISIVRLSKGFAIKQDELVLPKFVKEEDFKCAESLCTNLNKKYRIPFTRTEIDGIALLLASYNISFPIEEMTLDNLHQYLWPSLYLLFNEITDTLKNLYRIDILKKPSNAIGLAIHLRSLIHRSSVNMFADNPMSYSIKNLYPISFECSIYIARKIFEYYQILITEDEMTFLAIYVANNMRVYHSIKGKISVLFVIPNYSIISNELYEYYKNRFDNDIHSQLLPQIDKIDKDKYDLIVTTATNPFYGPIPVITINPFVNTDDENLLQEKIATMKKEKKKNYVLNTLAGIMDESFCFFDKNHETLDECLIEMIEALFNKNITSKGLKEDVLIRAKLANTTSNSVALLRPCLSFSSANSLSYMKLQHPIGFNNEKITSILFLTFNETKFIDYLNVMEYLYFFLHDKNNAKRVNEIKSFDELKTLLLTK